MSWAFHSAVYISSLGDSLSPGLFYWWYAIWSRVRCVVLFHFQHMTLPFKSALSDFCCCIGFSIVFLDTALVTDLIWLETLICLSHLVSNKATFKCHLLKHDKFLSSRTDFTLILKICSFVLKCTSIPVICTYRNYIGCLRIYIQVILLCIVV